MRWTLALVAWLGCYAPSAQPGATCANGVCPDGLVCSPATNTCERTATPVLDSGATDGLGDAPPVNDAAGDAALPTATLIQQATSSVGTGAMLSATLPAAPVAGHMLVLIGATPSGALTAVTGGGATWTRAAASLINTNVELWFGITDGSSATVTISRTNNASTMWLAVSEWAGLASAMPVDQATVNDGTTSPVSAGSITTTNPRDLVIFAATAPAPNSYGVPSPGTWNAMTGISTLLITQSAWYRVETATGTFAPEVTQTGASWDAAVVAVRLAP